MNCLKAAVYFTAFLQTFSCWVFQLSFELSRMLRSFVFGLALMWWMWVVSWVCWLRMRLDMSPALVADWVKLTGASLFISRGELKELDHSKTLLLHSIMSLMVLQNPCLIPVQYYISQQATSCGSLRSHRNRFKRTQILF